MPKKLSQLLEKLTVASGDAIEHALAEAVLQDQNAKRQPFGQGYESDLFVMQRLIPKSAATTLCPACIVAWDTGPRRGPQPRATPQCELIGHLETFHHWEKQRIVKWLKEKGL